MNSQPLLQQPQFEKHKKIIFAVMLYGFFTQCMNLTILGPFFPIKADQYDISDTMIGIIFSGFPLGAVISTVFIRKRMNGQRKLYMIVGVLLIVIGMVGFGSVFYLQNKILIIIASMVFRIISGIGMSMYDVPGLSFIPLLFRSKIDRKLGIIEGVQNIGFMLGPLLGTVLYNIGSYEIPFFTMAALQFITIPLLIFVVPKQTAITSYLKTSSLEIYQQIIKDDINQQDQEKQITVRVETNQADIKGGENHVENQLDLVFPQTNQKVTYLKAISHFRVFLIIIMIFFAACGFLFLDSSYAQFLQKRFQLSQNEIDYLFVASYSCSTISSLIVSLFTGKRTTNLKIMFCGFILLIISYLFIGPAQFFNMHSNLVVTTIARCLIACFQSVVYIPAIKEFYFTLQMIFHECYDDQLLSNMSSTLYILSQQGGELIGPVIGNIIIQHLSFKEASSYLALFAFGFTILLIISSKAFKKVQYQEFRANQIKSQNQNQVIAYKQPTQVEISQDQSSSQDSKYDTTSELSNKQLFKAAS